MKKLITTYTFVPAAKTIELDDYAAVDIKGLLLITNVTDNIIIYNFADSAKGGTAAGNTITLTYDTSAMDAGDDLQIFYDDADYEDNKATVIYESGTIMYVCSAAIASPVASAVWQIKKVDTTNGTVVTWCDGNDSYDNVATNLGVVAALSYS